MHCDCVRRVTISHVHARPLSCLSVLAVTNGLDLRPKTRVLDLLRFLKMLRLIKLNKLIARLWKPNSVVAQRYR